MARNNIPGDPRELQNAVKAQKGAASPDADSSHLDSNLQDYVSLSLAGKGQKAVKALEYVQDSIGRIHRDSESSYKLSEKMAENELRWNREEYNLARRNYEVIQSKLRTEERINGSYTVRAQQLRNDLALAKSSYELSAKDLSLSGQRIDKIRASRKEEAAAYDSAMNRSKKAARELDEAMEKRNRSFGASLVRNHLNPMSAAREYSANKLKAGFANGDTGDMALGAVGLAGGLVLGKMIEKITDVAKRSIQASISYGDVSKSVIGFGESSQDLRTQINYGQVGLGTTIEEKVQLAQMLRKSGVGRIGASSFAEAMRIGVSQDRGFGMETGTGVSFMGQMLRKTGLQANDGDMNKLSMSIAEAIGRGRLVGLQEEMLSGINQLVDATRAQSIAGVDGGMFANIIADISGRGARNLRGEDAARFAGNFGNALANSNEPFVRMTASAALENVINNLHKEGKLDRSYNDFSAEEIIGIQKAGLAATVKDSKGKSIPIGDLYQKAAIDFIKNVSPNDDVSALLGPIFGSSTEQMRAMVGLKPKLQNGEFGKAFNYNGQAFASPAAIKFIQDLNDQFASAANGRTADQISPAEKKAWLALAANQMSQSLSGGQLDEFNAIRQRTADKDVGEQFNQLLEFAGKVTQTAPEDALRNVVTDIDNQIQSYADAIIPLVSKIAYWVENKTGTAQESEEAAAVEAQRLAKYRRQHSPEYQKEQDELKRRYEELRQKKLLQGETPSPKPMSAAESAAIAAGVVSDRNIAAATSPESNLSANDIRTRAIKEYASKKAAELGLPTDIMLALIRQESHFDPHATSNKGAMGLMQLMPGTAKDLGVTDPYNAIQNINGGMKQFSYLMKRYDNNVEKALVAYNWGSVHADKWNGDRSKLPAETKDYLERIYDGAKNNTPPQTAAQKNAQDNSTSAKLENRIINRIETQDQNGSPIASPQTYVSQIGPLSQKVSFFNPIKVGQGE